MNFDFSQDQKNLQQHAREFLSENCNYAILRKGLASGDEVVRSLWQQLTELGWTAISIPERDGGVGLGALEVCVLMEEMGRVLMPAPFFSTVCLGVELLKSLATEAAERLLKQVVAGTTICVDGIGPLDLDVKTLLLRVSEGNVSGRIEKIRDLPLCDVLLCPALSDTGEVLLIQVDLRAAEVLRGGAASMDALVHFGWAELHGVPATVLARGEQVIRSLALASDRAATYMAFEQIGGAEAAYLMAKEYALTRYAFGRPIGSNQAIKHKLSDMVVRIELARSNAFYAAWAAAHDAPEQRIAAATARISAADAYDFAAEECLQVHGGIGYTWEADCHFHYKRARLLSVGLGGSTAWSLRLLNALEHSSQNNA